MRRFCDALCYVCTPFLQKKCMKFFGYIIHTLCSIVSTDSTCNNWGTIERTVKSLNYIDILSSYVESTAKRVKLVCVDIPVHSSLDKENSTSNSRLYECTTEYHIDRRRYLVLYD